jgi:hypothetical protein
VTRELNALNLPWTSSVCALPTDSDVVVVECAAAASSHTLAAQLSWRETTYSAGATLTRSDSNIGIDSGVGGGGGGGSGDGSSGGVSGEVRLETLTCASIYRDYVADVLRPAIEAAATASLSSPSSLSSSSSSSSSSSTRVWDSLTERARLFLSFFCRLDDNRE